MEGGTSDETIGKVMEAITMWFMGPENRAENTFNAWADKHAHVFEGHNFEVEADEQNQEHFQAYKNYEAMVDKEIESLLEESSIAKEQFEEALVETKQKGSRETEDLIDFLISATDYDQFLLMVRDYQSKKAQEGQEEK